MKRYAIPKTPEFRARQIALDFGALVQRAIHDTRALLRDNLTRIKKQWRTWFPTPAIVAPFQLVLPADDFHQLRLIYPLVA